MNPPTDPLQLLVYGIGTILVVAALKLWDRRRDGRIQRALDETTAKATEAAAHASTAAENSSAAVAATGRVENTTDRAGRQLGAQTEELLQVGHDTNAMLLNLAREIGGLQEQLRRLSDLPRRVERIEEHLDDLTYTNPVRRRREDQP